MILLVSSNKDIASLNIKKSILAIHPFKEIPERFQDNLVYETYVGNRSVKLVTLNSEAVYAQNILDSFSTVELVVFISRHSSLSGTPTLSVHAPGNLSNAELGGIPRRVSVSPANAMRDTLIAMRKMKQEMQLNYEISYECTHHGPSLDVPTMFSELGSSQHQWSDLRAVEAVAYATIKGISKFGDFPAKTVLGIGGPHYQTKFTRAAFEKGLAFGHMIPKHAISALDLNILKHCIERTLEKTRSAVLDWKGIKGENKKPLIRLLEEANIPSERI